jgi:CMP-N-acetylneuraminic acid synthetase
MTDSMAIRPPNTPPRVTVYVPSHNYGRFLGQALESVAAQSLAEWELIVIDDGSIDETTVVAKAFADRFPASVRVVRHEQPAGLHACSNEAFGLARAEYVMRLDADDYLDESALHVLAHYLDRHPDVDLVYPNYVYVDEQGRYLASENRKRIGQEAKLLDLPAHGACTMIRKRVLKAVGGYSETASAQDGYDLWLKVLQRYGAQVANVTTPLFYYRQHGASLSRDRERILAARRQIKRDLVERHHGPLKPRTVAIVGAKNTYENAPNIVLENCAGRPLIDYTIEGALAAGVFDRVFVTTDDERVVAHCRRWPEVLAEVRPAGLSLAHVRVSEIVSHAVERLEQAHDIYPDVLVQLSVHAPLRRAEHIREALDTLIAYDCDSVVSVYEDWELHFVHGANGLEPLNPGMIARVQLEREALYVDNAAIHALWRDAVRADDLYGSAVGHVVMAWEDSVQARSLADLSIVETMMRRRHAAAPLR